MGQLNYTMRIIISIWCLSICYPQIFDYSLEDINNLSSTYGQIISPGFFQGNVTLHYFGHQNWGTCTARVGQLNALYQDLLNQDINNVQIIAIGKGQYSSDNSNWTGDNTIPVVNDPFPNGNNLNIVNILIQKILI